MSDTRIKIYRRDEPARGSFLLTIRANRATRTDDECGPEQLKVELAAVVKAGKLVVSGSYVWGTGPDGSAYATLPVDPPESMRQTESFLRNAGFRAPQEIPVPGKQPVIRVRNWHGRD